MEGRFPAANKFGPDALPALPVPASSLDLMGKDTVMIICPAVGENVIITSESRFAENRAIKGNPPPKPDVGT